MTFCEQRMSDLILPADPNVEHMTEKLYSLSNSLVLDPATSNEVEKLIDQLSNQKTIGHKDQNHQT